MRDYAFVGILLGSISTLQGMDALRKWWSHYINKKDNNVIPGAVSFIIHESTECFRHDCKKGRRLSSHEHCPGHSDCPEVKEWLEDQDFRVVAFYDNDNKILKLEFETISTVPRFKSSQQAYKKLDQKAQALAKLS